MMCCGKSLTTIELASVKTECNGNITSLQAVQSKADQTDNATLLKSDVLEMSFLYLVQLDYEQKKPPKNAQKMPKNGIFLPFWLYFLKTEIF